ncbi:hypothetical protein KIN20_025470 [Parelaphostrongylus tenuis]|uniref:Uncharacterized protein n=1 Tax=Parelaphostrongylus tenuis TaxID=148309 RepID=A0AAD5QXS5_PARTN|nr:hypothetical protein KIN20_025470 [Parelaphostrongylus tenuis]
MNIVIGFSTHSTMHPSLGNDMADVVLALREQKQQDAAIGFDGQNPRRRNSLRFPAELWSGA